MCAHIHRNRDRNRDRQREKERERERERERHTQTETESAIDTDTGTDKTPKKHTRNTDRPTCNKKTHIHIRRKEGMDWTGKERSEKLVDERVESALLLVNPQNYKQSFPDGVNTEHTRGQKCTGREGARHDTCGHQEGIRGMGKTIARKAAEKGEDVCSRVGAFVYPSKE